MRVRGGGARRGPVDADAVGFPGDSAFLVTSLVAARGFDQATAAAAFSLLFVGAAVAQVTAGDLELPKMTLYGVWKGKDGPPGTTTSSGPTAGARRSPRRWNATGP